VKAPRLGYLRVRGLDDVFAAFETHGAEAKILAGGQSLVPALNLRLLEPRLLVDINGIAGLDAIEERAGHLRIGALARLSAVGRSPAVARLAPLIGQAIPFIAHPAIRNRGTFAGSLAQADPAAELPACAVALDAVLNLASRRGMRRLAARDFFQGLYETALAPDELVTAIDVPPPHPRTRHAFLELARRRGDYAIIGLAARLENDRLRLVYFGAGVKPVEAKAAATALGTGRLADRLAAAQEALVEDLDPPADLNADATTKRHLARVLLARAVRALDGAGA
jgi:aerobic carbon-monoxide dehydrogenase medium subunit